MNKHMLAHFKLYAASDEFDWAGHNKYSFNDIPTSHTWAAMDDDGRWWAYRDRPVFRKQAGCWDRLPQDRSLSVLLGYTTLPYEGETLLLFKQSEQDTHVKHR